MSHKALFKIKILVQRGLRNEDIRGKNNNQETQGWGDKKILWSTYRMNR